MLKERRCYIPNTNWLNAVLYSLNRSPSAALSSVYTGSTSIRGVTVCTLPFLNAADPGNGSLDRSGDPSTWAWEESLRRRAGSMMAMRVVAAGTRMGLPA